MKLLKDMIYRNGRYRLERVAFWILFFVSLKLYILDGKDLPTNLMIFMQTLLLYSIARKGVDRLHERLIDNIKR